jgi:serine/threonine-protein kinase
VGQPLDIATQLIQDAGLTRGDIEERADATFAIGTVIEQSPASGVRVGLGTPINLVVSSGPETVIVPELVGLTERAAIGELQAIGLLFTSNEEYSNSTARGLVIRTDPEKDAVAQSGDTVLLVVSLGPAPVDVPNLIGMTPAQAEAILGGDGLVMSISATTLPVADPSQDGLIVDQVPTVGATLFPGDIVRVTLGKFIPPPTTAPPEPTTTAP